MNKKKYQKEESDEYWSKQLDENKYSVLLKKGTEKPFSGKFNLHFEKGTYNCGACNFSLFNSDNKFDSGCGWPSFDDAKKDAVEFVLDKSLGMLRTEIVCSNCGSHLGHIFNDGPTETGQRFCVNSLSLDFEKE